MPSHLEIARRAQRMVAAGLGILVAALLGHPCQGAEDFASEFPVPPQQQAAWSAQPDGTLDASFLRACRLLFEAGLADPRGCRYRSVLVQDYQRGWGDTPVQQVRLLEPMPDPREPIHAWVMPSTGSDTTYVIGWNGLVYPALWIGPEADLAADCAAMELAQPEPPPGRQMDQIGGDPASPGTTTIMQLHQHVLLPLKLCLLARLGYGKDVARMRQQLAESTTDGGADMQPGRDPLPTLAAAYLSDLMQRTLSARMLGDDRMALNSVRQIPRALEVLRVLDHGTQRFAPPPANWIAPWSQWREVLMDQEGRPYATLPPLLVASPHRNPYLGWELRDPAQPTVPLRHAQDPTATTPAATALRIRRLIDNLDNAAAPMPQTFWCTTREDLLCAPNVWALVDEGDQAIDPLFACLAHDQRLTRVISMQGEAIPVWWAAAACLEQLLHCDRSWPAFQPLVPDLSEDARQRILHHLQDLQAHPRDALEVAYRTLGNDTASQREWMMAAGGMTQWADEEHLPRLILVPTRDPSHLPRLVGEPLRHGHQPTVTELLERRLTTVLTQPPDTTLGDGRAASALADALAVWDGAAALPLLQRACHHLAALNHQWSNPDWEVLIKERTALGDASAGEEWASVLQALEPKGTMQEGPLLVACWLTPTPTVQATLAAVMAHWPVDDPGHLPLDHLIFTLPALQAWLQGRLQDTTPTLAVAPASTTAEERPLPVPITQRVCDVWCNALSAVNGFPLFPASGSIAARDATIAQALDLLRRYGPWYKARWQRDRALYSVRDTEYNYAWLVPPPLDHPATAADVRSGRALFALEEAERQRARVVTGLDASWDVRWPAFTEDFQEYEHVDIHHHRGVQRMLFNTGHVIQAEEIQTDLGLKRWIGLVLPHRLVRVDADALQLADQNLPEGWHLAWDILDGAARDILGTARFGTHAPPVIGVQLRNTQLRDHAVPAWIANERSHEWWSAVRPELRRYRLMGTYSPVASPDDLHGWDPVPPLQPIRWVDHPDARGALPPGGYSAILPLHLDAWYPCLQPGFYAFRLGENARSASPTWTYFAVGATPAP